MTNKVKKWFLDLGLLLVMVCPTWAASVSLTWDPVTTYADTVPIEVGEVVKYDVWRDTNSNLSGAIRLAFDLTATNYSDASVVSKNTYYYFVRAYIVDTVPSDRSNVASVRIWPPFKPVIRSIVVVK
jgi:hypothetical protein